MGIIIYEEQTSTIFKTVTYFHFHTYSKQMDNH
jgi:hypothetical protein